MKIERQVKRNTEVDTCCNNIKLLTEMLNHYSPSSPAQDKELMKVSNIIFMVQWTCNNLTGWIISFILSLHTNRDFKLIAMVTSTMAVMDLESWGEYFTVACQISTLNMQCPNSDYEVSCSFAFAVSKMQGRLYYWKTGSIKYFLDKVKNNLW